MDDSVSHRNGLVERYRPLALAIAKSVHRSLPRQLVELDDLVQAAMVGLIQAAERYDPETDFSFAALARSRVRGACLDAVRAAARCRHRRRAAAREAVSPDNPEDGAARSEAQSRVRAALVELPPRERAIVLRHWMAGVSLAAVAAELGVSKTRAAQIHSRALGRIRLRLAA
jgi:RNA polymerase sigma factor for flagellar operon FliA